MSAERRRGVLLVLLLLTLFVPACGAKRVVPPSPTAPRYPDFIFPDAPAGLASAPTMQQHREAWQYLQAGDTHSADRELSAILKSAPGFYPAEAALGYSALARKDAGAAVNHFDRALATNGAYAPALVGKGDALLAENHADQALDAFRKALAADPALPGLQSRVQVLEFRTVQQSIGVARKAAEDGKLDDARRNYQVAITASPESAFLFRELAIVDRRAGDQAAALAHAGQAAKLDPSDARALTIMAEIYEENHDWSRAADTYAAAAALEPGEALSAKVDAMRARASFDSMPAEYRSIDQSPSITRAQLAALLGVRLEALLRTTRATSAPVITDARESWAAPWILTVTRAGVMDVFSNHTFQPNAIVRRSDLAHAVSRVLTLIGTEKPRLAAKWRDPRPHFSDVSPSHLSYPAAARSVSAGVLDPLEGETFQLTRVVSGAEAVQALTRLEALANSR